MKDKMVLKRKLKSALSVFMITALALGFVPGTDFGLEAHAAAATKPADPTRTGFTFKGWFADAELKTPYDFIGKEEVTRYVRSK